MIPNLLSLSYILPFVAHKLDLSGAVRGLRGMPRRVLLIGHRGSTGTATVGAITKNVGTESAALALLGEGSMLMAMWRGAKANAELGLPIDVLCVAENASGVAASGTITITGIPAQSGECMLHIAGMRFGVGVGTSDTVATIATKLTTAINADATLPVTAASAAGVITLTCRWRGLSGNDIDVRGAFAADDNQAIGIAVATPGMSGGATSPDLSVYLTASVNYRATEIACAFSDSANMVILEQEQETRWQCDNMQDGQVIVALRGNLSAHTAWLSTRNSAQCHSLHVYKDRTPPWVTAAMAASAIESSAAIDSATPYTGIKLTGYKGPAQADAWDLRSDANNIALQHGSVIKAQDDGSGTLLRVFNHYKKSTSGAADYSQRDLCWIKLSSYWRWLRVSELQNRYQNGWKLAEYIKEPIPGQKIMTAELAQEICLQLYGVFMDAGLFQNLEHYKKTWLGAIDGASGKVKIIDEPVMVTQLYQWELTSNLIAGHV